METQDEIIQWLEREAKWHFGQFGEGNFMGKGLKKAADALASAEREKEELKLQLESVRPTENYLRKLLYNQTVIMFALSRAYPKERELPHNASQTQEWIGLGDSPALYVKDQRITELRRALEEIRQIANPLHVPTILAIVDAALANNHREKL